MYAPCAGIAGDITPVCAVSDAEKFALESAALQQLKGALGECLAAEEIEKLWHEYEAGETPEAKLVKDFDKVRDSKGLVWLQVSFCVHAGWFFRAWESQFDVLFGM